MAVIGAPITGSPAALYATIDDMNAVAGKPNIVNYSCMDGTNTLDTSRIQTALDQSDAEINLYLSRNGIAYPIANTDPFYLVLTQASARLATLWLYRSRGNLDMTSMNVDQSNSEYYQKLGGWKKEAYGLMQKYCLSARQNISCSFAVSREEC